MSRYSNTLRSCGLFVFLLPISAFATTTATSTLPVSSSTPPQVAVSFCEKVEELGLNIRTTAVMNAAEHRAELERLSFDREEEKRRLGEARAEVRQKEDFAREALIDIFLQNAKNAEAKEAVDRFATASAKLLRDLRTASDRAREDYAKVTRTVSLTERAKRNKVLDAYVEKLDRANEYAEEQCAKGAKEASVLASYNIWLSGAKQELALNLKQKKSTLEQRARDVHQRELARLDDEYRRKMQAELFLLTEKFPELFVETKEVESQETIPDVKLDVTASNTLQAL